VLAASVNDNEVAWYENDSSMGFTKHSITTAASGARWVTAIDMDQDGDIDVLSSDAGNPVSEIAWWQNDGSQTFTKHSIVASSTKQTFRMVRAVDLDLDGDIDTYIHTHTHTHTLLTLLSYQVRAVDLDLDGDIDVLFCAYKVGVRIT
jgi:hypothetical protein